MVRIIPYILWTIENGWNHQPATYWKNPPKKTNIHLPMFEKQQRTAAMSLKFAVGQPAWDAKQHQRRHWDGSTWEATKSMAPLLQQRSREKRIKIARIDGSVHPLKMTRDDAIWLVDVGGWPTPMKNDGVRQLGWWHYQYMEKKHVPNHQPVMVWYFNECVGFDPCWPNAWIEIRVTRVQHDGNPQRIWWVYQIGSSKPCWCGSLLNLKLNPNKTEANGFV